MLHQRFASDLIMFIRFDNNPFYGDDALSDIAGVRKVHKLIVLAL